MFCHVKQLVPRVTHKVSTQQHQLVNIAQGNKLFCSEPYGIYRVSQEEWTKLGESVPYVELYRYNSKHLYPKLNGYGGNGQRSLKL